MGTKTVLDIRQTGATLRLVPEEEWDGRSVVVDEDEVREEDIPSSAPDQIIDDANTPRLNLMPLAAQLVENAFSIATAQALGAYFDEAVKAGWAPEECLRVLNCALEVLKNNTARQDLIKTLYKP